jgi:hypothetical protein
MAVVDPANLFKFAARYGNKLIQSQIELKSPLFASLDKVKMTGKVGNINIVKPAVDTVSFLDDNGTLPDGGSRTPIQGQVKPFAMAGTVEVGDITLASLTGADDSANYIVGELKAIGDTMAKVAGGALFSDAGLITSVTAFTTLFAAGSGRAVATVSAANGLAPGMAVELHDDGYNSQGNAFLVRIGKITLSSTDSTATVELVNDVPGASSLAFNSNANIDANCQIGGTIGHKLYVRGTWTNVGVNSAPARRNVSPVSLVDLSGSAAIYGLSESEMLECDFVGNARTVSAVPTHENIGVPLAMIAAKTGHYPTRLVGSQLSATALAFGAATAGGQLGSWNPTSGVGSGIRKMSGAKFDKYDLDGAKPIVAVNGIPFMVDNNCSPDQLFAFDPEHLKVGEWKPLGPKKQGNDTHLVSQSKLGDKMIFSQIYNIYCDKRNSITRISGLTTDLIS